MFLEVVRVGAPIVLPQLFRTVHVLANGVCPAQDNKGALTVVHLCSVTTYHECIRLGVQNKQSPSELPCVCKKFANTCFPVRVPENVDEQGKADDLDQMSSVAASDDLHHLRMIQHLAWYLADFATRSLIVPPQESLVFFASFSADARISVLNPPRA